MNSDIIRRTNPADDYELLQRVGSGTYGDVYKARQLRTGNLAAVKVVKLEAGDNFTVIQQEIVVLRDCAHPNIISYYGSYLRRDRLWIAMEYCEGGSLQDIYQMTGPLSELQIAYVCRETLKGLEYLHSRLKVHRDIKGANILLTGCGEVKLADFGVAAQITQTIAKRKSFIGTPYWMAPEVASVERKGVGYDFQCDVWAVGITAIELAECQPPRFDMQPMQVLQLMNKSSYKPPTLQDKNKWSPMFHDFVRQCLTKSPKKRPPPGKLLAEHNFVMGALSSRMTKELLDKVNGIASSASFSENSTMCEDDVDQAEMCDRTGTLTAGDASNNEKNNSSNGLMPVRTLPPLPDIVSSECLLHDSNGVAESTRSLLHGSHAVRSLALDEMPCSSSLALDSKRITLGLPATPEVDMGACFSQILHDCTYKINAAVTWLSPSGSKEWLLLGCEEGIYGVNVCELFEGGIARLDHRRCSWMHVRKNTLITIQGRTSHVFTHDLEMLTTQKNFTLRFRKKLSSIPDKLVPKQVAVTTRINETKNVCQCTIFRAKEGVRRGSLYMCCRLASSILLYQWYEPMKGFVNMRSSSIPADLKFPLRPFQLIDVTGTDFPKLCVGVRRRKEAESGFLFRWILFGEREDCTLRPPPPVCEDNLDVVSIVQLQRAVIAFAWRNKVFFTDPDGVPLKEFSPEMKFSFPIDYLLDLPQSILVFHTHGVEGRSLTTGEKTQEINDPSKIYRVVGNDRFVIIAAHALQSCEKYNICVLTGHEEMPRKIDFVD